MHPAAPNCRPAPDLTVLAALSSPAAGCSLGMVRGWVAKVPVGHGGWPLGSQAALHAALLHAVHNCPPTHLARCVDECAVHNYPPTQLPPTDSSTHLACCSCAGSKQSCETAGRRPAETPYPHLSGEWRVRTSVVVKCTDPSSSRRHATAQAQVRQHSPACSQRQAAGVLAAWRKRTAAPAPPFRRVPKGGFMTTVSAFSRACPASCRTSQRTKSICGFGGTTTNGCGSGWKAAAAAQARKKSLSRRCSTCAASQGCS